MQSWLFKLGVVLLGTSLLGWILDFFFLSDPSTASRVLLWYLALGSAGAVLLVVGRKA